MSCMSLEACPTGQQKQHPKPCPLEFKSTNGHTFIRTPFKWTDGDPMKTILYARVSTADQTIAHQRKQAEAAGFQIDTVVADEGVSGVHTRLADRPEGRRLFDLLRAGPQDHLSGELPAFELFAPTHSDHSDPASPSCTGQT